MFDMIRVAPICVRADREVQGSICERLTLPDNPRRTSGPIEVLDKIFPPILGRGKSGLNRAKNPVVWARHNSQQQPYWTCTFILCQQEVLSERFPR